jgi:hypothetical protein
LSSDSAALGSWVVFFASRRHRDVLAWRRRSVGSGCPQPRRQVAPPCLGIRRRSLRRCRCSRRCHRSLGHHLDVCRYWHGHRSSSCRWPHCRRGHCTGCPGLRRHRLIDVAPAFCTVCALLHLAARASWRLAVLVNHALRHVRCFHGSTLRVQDDGW